MPTPIVLDLPAPPSVNRTRKIDWRNYKHTAAWLKDADTHFLLQKRKLPPSIFGPFELTIVLREGSRMDPDNGIKAVCDALRRFNLITDDSPKYMRRIIIEFGDVEGCRVTVRSYAG